MIKFLLNRELRVEESIDPNMTVLQYLRTEAGKTGTKEGCASGDCGACTVVVGELDGEDIRYKSINSCLTFLSALHGKQLITVEDLKEGSQLHPAQQALVDQHGSQCGFCTPGFVMSMFALGKNIADPNKAQIEEALAGNLCRCTGYRPIVDAAESMYQNTRQDQFDRDHAQTVARLRALQIEEQPQLNDGSKQAHNPRSIAELAELLSQNPDARLVAGGTDLALEVTQFHRELETLIYVGDIAEMKQVTVHDDRIELGAAAPLTDCYKALANDFPDFGNLLHRFASLQIRNQGTLGGNIGNASPIGDSPPALIALNAEVVLRQGNGSRTIKLEDYFIDYKVTAQQPGEFIEKVVVPRVASNEAFRSYKISKRIDDDISAVLGCFNLTIKDGVIHNARVAFGGMAAIPKRAQHCEAALTGQAWNAATIKQAKQALANDFAPISDFRASKEYRMLTATNMLTRYFVELDEPATDSRVFSDSVVQSYIPEPRSVTTQTGGSAHV
ncbi:xanthine dehydrogenase small subunit [Motiliproteus coralliicola]|uniref:Xanthine dehydrogenase small subunit n=1 Tax=Motiliproteus coralliicola TaxID=2283196 RepID=A0A369WTQ1_9GAMM|nr:xanthine dehydrogenase small subunit [Motiliproteus coralliicola]RDE22875.1 xanthine dehydrogenase small subunit [Motiliproteus coralliicola]